MAMARKKIIEQEPVMIEPKRQARFYVHARNFNPQGYRCYGIAIMREPKETDEELRKRCRDQVEWPDANTVHVFIPIN